VILNSRPQKLPGQFKINANRAGKTFFVLPKDVLGTLGKGFEVLSSISSPLARALYMMSLISEVHPFEDGNGRVARLMMNAELTAGGQTKIIIQRYTATTICLTFAALSENTTPPLTSG
jgi:fido (protein-threonine AMPylation protein)